MTKENTLGLARRKFALQMTSINRGTAANVHGPTCWPHGDVSRTTFGIRGPEPSARNPRSSVGVINYRCLKSRYETQGQRPSKAEAHSRMRRHIHDKPAKVWKCDVCRDLKLQQLILNITVRNRELHSRIENPISVLAMIMSFCRFGTGMDNGMQPTQLRCRSARLFFFSAVISWSRITVR